MRQQICSWNRKHSICNVCAALQWWYFLLLETWPQTENFNFHFRQIVEDIFAQEKRWPLDRVEFCTYDPLMHGFYISPSNIIDIRPATFIMYKNAKFFALFFTWMFNLKSPDQFFISLNLFNQYQWCDVMLINFVSSMDTETSYQQFLPLSCQLNIDNSLDIVCVHNL